jgi:hypothetical protein
MLATKSRNERQLRIDTWLRDNADLVSVEDGNSIARSLQEAGLYSQNTSLIDIHMSFRRRCIKIGITFKS